MQRGHAAGPARDRGEAGLMGGPLLESRAARSKRFKPFPNLNGSKIFKKFKL
jgi:hypothetical protein